MRRRTAWVFPFRSKVPALTFRSATVGTVAVGTTSNGLAASPAPRRRVPSFTLVAPVL